MKEKLLRDAFNKVKSEMTDHLEAINENTQEINAQQHDMQRIENMLLKLHERLDDIEIQLNKSKTEYKQLESVQLSPKEQEIFLLLYSRNGDLMDYREISRTLGYREKDTRRHVNALVRKGIPIIKKYVDNIVYLILDADFSDLQAKEHIVKTH